MLPEPIATYRLQLQPAFGFAQAAEAAGYLSLLGISHLYTSPCFQAVAGSTHGYDITNCSRINEELGGPEAHAQFSQRLETVGLGRLIDIVPNHVAIPGCQNPWWWDVLKNGPSSRFANYFDVDWDASEERWPNKILLPVLADHYGRILEKGELRLSHQSGVFTLHYHAHLFPIDSSSLVDVLSRAANACESDPLAFIAESHGRIPQPAATGYKMIEIRHRDKSLLMDLLTRLCHEERKVLEAIDAEVARINQDADALDALIEQQNYRLAYWKTAGRDLGYRRFFDIKDLAGLRIENLDVFQAIHALPLEWMEKGWIQGLRVDHIDGLRNPAEYLERLRQVFPKAWVLVEKILAPFETLPAEWPVQGTTGYDFLNLIGNLFIDSKSKDALTKVYESFVGVQANYQQTVVECKRLVMNELLGSELNRLTTLFVHICERHRQYRDYTRHEIQEAICETAVHFPVYRTYVPPKGLIRPEDIKYLSEAIEKAMSALQHLDAELFLFLKSVLLLETAGNLEIEFAMRFQQLTGPAMAKGVEDTTFYRFNRLISLNEVGGDPDQFGISLSDFHQACEGVQKYFPMTLLATTTHDTKRSEDVRSRLALLSEIPVKWDEVVKRWSKLHKKHLQGGLPDRNIEYYFYQTLVGAWPIDPQRMLTHMQKASREAKEHTSWLRPNDAYETALKYFITSVMADEDFQVDLSGFVKDLLNAGRINSLSQTLIKFTAPGIPDIYQGTELWTLSLVDPDNRKPVDFALRQNLLDALTQLSVQEILARMDEGLPKLWVTQQALILRNEKPLHFGSEGSYHPLHATGPKADHVVAFLRGTEAITIAPRLVMQLEGKWCGTRLQLPEGVWHNLLSNETGLKGNVLLEEILAKFPVGLLVKIE